MIDITLLTASAYLQPENPDWYVKQILQEDQLLRKALERKGLRVHRIDWTNEEFDWSTTRCVLFRATWDYLQRYDQFVKFITTVTRSSKLINPLETILWNLDKHYLRDLEERGISIPQTIYIEKNASTSLRQLHLENGLTETILKPAISAGALHTYRLNKDNLLHHETIFQQLIANEAMMLQPFLRNVLTRGEITLVVIGGNFSHAVLKKTTAGDFRVQDDFGGTVHSYEPSEEEISFAEKAVSACFPIPAYARVDMLRDNDNQLVVSELELIEPELWFRCSSTAADVLAEVIQSALNS